MPFLQFGVWHFEFWGLGQSQALGLRHLKFGFVLPCAEPTGVAVSGFLDLRVSRFREDVKDEQKRANQSLWLPLSQIQAERRFCQDEALSRFLWPGVGIETHIGSCQNYGPFLGTLNNRCRTHIEEQKGTLGLVLEFRLFPSKASPRLEGNVEAAFLFASVGGEEAKAIGPLR